MVGEGFRIESVGVVCGVTGAAGDRLAEPAGGGLVQCRGRALARVGQLPGDALATAGGLGPLTAGQLGVDQAEGGPEVRGGGEFLGPGEMLFGRGPVLGGEGDHAGREGEPGVLSAELARFAERFVSALQFVGRRLASCANARLEGTGEQAEVGSALRGGEAVERVG